MLSSHVGDPTRTSMQARSMPTALGRLDPSPECKSGQKSARAPSKSHKKRQWHVALCAETRGRPVGCKRRAERYAHGLRLFPHLDRTAESTDQLCQIESAHQTKRKREDYDVLSSCSATIRTPIRALQRKRHPFRSLDPLAFWRSSTAHTRIQRRRGSMQTGAPSTSTPHG